MNFSQAEAYLRSTVGELGSPREPYRLDRMRALMRELGDPQNAYPTVHVGGTSGKGSTSTMVASILSASGKRTGLHTKPHLRSVTERARIDGVPVSGERFAELLAEMMPALERITGEFSRPSYYETTLALAFLYFAREEVDAAVIEVGIGGKLDGTNIIRPSVAVITNVGLDHTEILGDTLEAIAADKAGIAKEGVPLVSAVADAGPRAIVEARCREVGAPFVSVLDNASIEEVREDRIGQSFAVDTGAERYDISLPLLGEFQQRNAATAIVALERLPDALRPSKDDVERGLAAIDLTGRMEHFAAHPALVFDVAHNPDKAANLARSLLRSFPERRFVFVLAIGTSKNAAEIVNAFAPLPATFVFTSFEAHGREAIKPQRLASIAEDLGVWGRAVADPVEALTIARRNAASDDVVVVTGSTFVVAELREWWMENVVASGSPR